MSAGIEPEQAALLRRAEARWLRQSADRLRRQVALKRAATTTSDRLATVRNPR